MLQGQVLILEFGTVDRLATGAVASGEVTSLDHKLLDNPVENRSFVVQRFAHLPHSLLAGAQRTEVLCGLGHEVIVELKCDPTSKLAPNCDVEEDAAAALLSFLVGGHCGWW